MTGGLIGAIRFVGAFINEALPVVISLTVLVFVWGLFKLVMAGDSEDARAEARGYITWGVVALFVMVSVWGLVNILIRTFNLSNGMPPLPEVPDVGAGGSTGGGYTGGDVKSTQGYSNAV